MYAKIKLCKKSQVNIGNEEAPLTKYGHLQLFSCDVFSGFDVRIIWPQERQVEYDRNQHSIVKQSSSN